MFKSVLITGASRGIGAALSLYYAKLSNVIIIVGRNEKDLLDIKTKCEHKNKNIVVVIGALDVSDSNSFSSWLKEICSKYEISIVIANAGIVSQTGENAFNDTFGVNVFGVFHTLFPILEQMEKNKKGEVVIINSVSSFIPLPDFTDNNDGGISFSTYAASKRCVLNWAIASQERFKLCGINIHLICPGYVKTNFLSYFECSRKLEKQINTKSFIDVSHVVECVDKSIKKGKLISFTSKSSPFMCLASFCIPLFFKQKIIESVAQFKPLSFFQIIANVKNLNPTNILAFISSDGFGHNLIEEYINYGKSISLCFTDNNKEFEAKILSSCSAKGANLISSYKKKDIDALIDRVKFNGDVDLLFFDFPIIFDDNEFNLSSMKKFFIDGFGRVVKILEKASSSLTSESPVQIVVSLPIVQDNNVICNAAVDAAMLYCESKREQLKKMGFGLSVVVPGAIFCAHNNKFAFMDSISDKGINWLADCSKAIKRRVAYGRFACYFPYFCVVFLILFKNISLLFPGKFLRYINKKIFEKD